MNDEKNNKQKQDDIFYRIPPADIDLTSDIRTSILVQSPRGGRAILWIVLLLCFVLGYWAYIAEIEQVTRGEGKVIPSSQIQVVQNLEGGIISEILVNVGDIVHKGQLLLRMDETRFSSSYQQNLMEYLALKAKAARLEAEANGTSFVVPEEVTEKKPEIGTREKQLFDARQQTFERELRILQEQIRQRQQELSELQSKEKELTHTYSLIQRELELTKPLVNQGAVSEVELLHLERQSSEMTGELEVIKHAIPRARSRYQEGLLALEAKKFEFRNKAKEELNDVLARLEGLSASAVALEDRLQRTSVRSPVHGTIKQLLVSTVGGVIQPGMDLMEIVPIEESLLIEAKIKPADIAFLRPNQKAKIKFTAYDFTIYGGLDARLEYIGADSTTDAQGNSYYLVRLRTDKNYLGPESQPLPIIPGMVATADILTGKKTILNYLLKPILRAKYMALRER